MKKLFPIIFPAFLFCFLLVFPAATLEASKRGLLLWFDTVLPTLLPFLILSQLILKTPLIDCFQRVFGPVFRKLFHCSDAGAFCILCGFLCGYPVGARLIALQLKGEKLTLAEGQFLLSFCNNVSPSFCISYGILYAIGAKKILPFLLLIYGSALLVGFFTRPRTPFDAPETAKKQTSTTENIFQLIDVCIIDSFLILIKLCGYLILFSILCTAVFQLISLHNPWLRAGIGAFLEITLGLSMLHSLPSGLVRSCLGIAALSFGGLCCAFQTNSVIHDTKLSFREYLCKKTVIALLALLLFFLWSFLF